MTNEAMDLENLKEGQYYYQRHRSKWGVWKVGRKAPNGAHMDDFVMDFSTKIQAEKFVYKMNMWDKQQQY